MTRVLASHNELKKKQKKVLSTLRISKSNMLTDPNTSLIKLRQALEFLIEYMYAKNNLNKEEDLFVSIETLKNNNITDNNTVILFHKVRKLGNKAVHEGYFNMEETRLLLIEMYNVLGDNSLEENYIVSENGESVSSYTESGEVIAEFIIKLFEQSEVPVSNYMVTIKSDSCDENIKHKVTSFSISTLLSKHKDYKLLLNIYNGEIELISAPIVEYISEFEKHMYINMVNWMNVNTLNCSFFIQDNNVYARTIKNYYPLDQLDHLDFILYDVFHSVTELVNNIREFLNLLISKKEGTI